MYCYWQDIEWLPQTATIKSIISKLKKLHSHNEIPAQKLARLKSDETMMNEYFQFEAKMKRRDERVTSGDWGSDDHNRINQDPSKPLVANAEEIPEHLIKLIARERGFWMCLIGTWCSVIESKQWSNWNNGYIYWNHYPPMSLNVPAHQFKWFIWSEAKLECVRTKTSRTRVKQVEYRLQAVLSIRIVWGRSVFFHTWYQSASNGIEFETKRIQSMNEFA